MASPSPDVEVAYLGPVASFSHQAALTHFPSNSNLHPLSTFVDVFSAVQNSDVTYGILPVENSTNGSVIQALDLLADRDNEYHDLKVCDEVYVTVHHYLLTGKDTTSIDKNNSNTTTTAAAAAAAAQQNGLHQTPSNRSPNSEDQETRYSKIQKLYTHPQAWGQCRNFLMRHFKAIERQDVSSTSKAAEIVSRDPSGTSAAIASKFAGEEHGCQVLAERIEDSSDNTTRFLVLRREASSSSQSQHHPTSTTTTKTTATATTEEPTTTQTKWKTLISLTISHSQPGALADALTVFKTHGLNLSSINSRPSRVRPWHYVFFVECDAARDARLEAALAELMDCTVSLRDWGTWRDMLG